MKFNVIGDTQNNKPRFSSHVIVSSLNDAAKKLGLFDENGIVVKYDCVCNTHGDKVDAFICSYELSFPEVILNNAAGKPIIGVSEDNKKFILEGGYPESKADFISLGVDSNLWKPVDKKTDLDKFCVGIYTESLVRGGIERCIEGFGKTFSGNKDVVLKIKDRNGTKSFQEYVVEKAQYYNINIDYFNEHWDIEKVKEWLSGIDCHLYTNYSSTFAMPPLELMSCGIPTLITSYSGPRDYCNISNSLIIKHKLEYVDEKLSFLLGIGCRNFFFLSGYKNRPVWAVPEIDSISDSLQWMYKVPHLRDDLHYKGRQTASNMTWENSALQLSKILEKLL